MGLYGKVFRTHILGKAIIVSTDPEVNKVVLQNQGNAFIPHYPKSISELLGKYSILHINGPLQKRLHALIGGFLRSPQFKAQITRDIEESVRHVFSSWMEKQDRRIYLQEESRKIAFEVMVKTLMSVGRGEDLNLLRREFEEYCKGLISLPIKLPGTRLYKSLKAKERMLKVVRSIIQQRKMAALEEKQGTNGLLNDVIDVLLRDAFESSSAAEEAQPRLPLDSIGENLIELMIPGEETVPTALTLAVKFLSDSPVVLARLLEENMELKRQKAKSGDEYYWTDYVSLPFTQNVRC
ncbi:3-epi-6-deoxocathasterone 23-monooxygenase CYP90C1-like [Coffea eugenioides]|uniref:3-epi-6-deoxocathasterone 23-monooxygenase CYP90C1-like n=1 Tax=Coffea eugenioides TaxID=49369 RepID=UPI000F613A4A|nr:3-epi-6-deoxocathasterone 23-monooxygenase CYP90C1-like [Coffea eugenioides]